MRLDGLYADVEDARYFLVDASFSDLLDHLPLAMGEAAGKWQRFAFQELVEQRFGHRVGKIGAVDRQGIERGNQMAFGIRLENKAAHTSSQHVRYNLFAVVHRIKQDFNFREAALQHMRQVETVELGQ